MLELSTLRAKTVTVTDRAGNVLYTLPTTVGQPGQGLRLDAQMNLVWSDMAKFMEDVKAVAAGALHTVFLKNNKTVWSVGHNHFGQLGNGKSGGDFFSNPAMEVYPVQVKKSSIDNDFFTGVDAIAAGGYHTVFLKNDGTVWAVGYNTSGQLGNGENGNFKTYPVKVQIPVLPSGVTVTEIAAGSEHTVFLTSAGTVYAVGLNMNGQLGDGTTTARLTPVQVSNISNVTAIAAGGQQTVVLSDAGTVYAFGFNAHGQLGNGTTTLRLTPVQVKNSSTDNDFLTGVTAIAAGYDHTVFLKSDNTVWAVGKNSGGQLGDGTSENKSYPVQVQIPVLPSGVTVTAIAAFSNHTVFLTSAGTVYAVGGNGYGQLGDGTTTPASTPVQVKADANNFLTNVKAIASNSNAAHTVFLNDSSTVYAVGLNAYGALGNGKSGGNVFNNPEIEVYPVQVMINEGAILK